MNRRYDEALEEARAFDACLDLTPVVEAMTMGCERAGYSGAASTAADALVAISQKAYTGPWHIAYPYT